MLIYEYDSSYPGPALPVVEISIRGIGSHDEVTLPARWLIQAPMPP